MLRQADTASVLVDIQGKLAKIVTLILEALIK